MKTATKLDFSIPKNDQLTEKLKQLANEKLKGKKVKIEIAY